MDCFWKGENDYASGVWSSCPISKWPPTKPPQFIIMLLYYKGSKTTWCGIIRSHFRIGQKDSKSSLFKSWSNCASGPRYQLTPKILPRTRFFGNSIHFADFYLLTHGDLEPRTACVWKPLPWSLRETENKTKIICHKKVTTRWAA